jgi:hypothetical protein
VIIHRNNWHRIGDRLLWQAQHQSLVPPTIDDPKLNLYSFDLTEPLPAFPLPLDGQSAEPIIELSRRNQLRGGNGG